jgi:tRNA A-37 threonylcarbamoyl transferase component Bud32/tetratricopeptide (TPR) repeat protein
MGAVYEGVRVDDFQKRVALKVIKQGLDSAYARVRFQQERQVLASLEHPNIARLLDGGETADGSPYLVLEFVEGEPITHYCERVQATREQRLRLFLEVCEAVGYAHRNLIVHRDIKPANILVTPDGQPKLLDFGIAKLIDANLDQTATMVQALTPSYASPEQVRGQAISTATDVYSLGVVLYEMLTAKLPYRIATQSPLDVDRAVCQEPPAPPNVSSDLDNILLMALRKEPARRYQSVGDFAADIQRHLTRRPVKARPDTFLYRTSRFVSRNRVVLGAAAVTGLAIVLALLASMHQAARAERRFNEVRRIANTDLFSIDRKIAAVAGTAEAREEIVRSALRYLQTLSKESGGDPAIEAELALAYERVGDVQGGMETVNLGQFDRALDSYEHSRAILDRLARKSPSRDTLLRLAGIYYKIGQLQVDTQKRSQALVSYRLGVEITERLGATGGIPYSLRYRGYNRISKLRVNDGDTQAALEAMRQTWSAAKAWADAEKSDEALTALAQVDRLLASFLKNRGDLENAISYANQGTAIASQLHEQAPKDPVRLNDLIWSYMGILTVPHPMDLIDGMKVADLTRGRDLAASFFAQDQKSQTARFASAISSVMLGSALLRTDGESGRAELRRAERLLADLETLAPNFNLYRQVRAIAIYYLADRATAGDLDRAVVVLKDCWKSDPEDTLSPLILVDLLNKTAELRRSRAAVAESAELAERLWKKYPRDLRMAAALASAYETEGKLARGNREFAQAAEWYGKSAELWKDWPNRGVSSFYDRNHLASAWKSAAECRRAAQ